MTPAESFADERQRRDGMFFTPLPFAEKGLEYIEKTLGKEWWKNGKYRLWDMAAGTGNLEYYLPQEALKYCYLSTLYPKDAELLRLLFPDAETFPYDYLNDDVDLLFSDSSGTEQPLSWKMPETLRNDLCNPKIKWIILINPPFATAQRAGLNGKSKTGVSDTKIRKRMHSENLGEVSRELFSQFLYRIKNEFKNRQAFLGLYSKIKYLNAANDQRLRDTFFRCTFKRGFLFSSVNFYGTSRSSPFPVSFAVWDINSGKMLENQPLVFDVFNSEAVKTGVKTITAVNRNQFLNKWVTRPRAVKTFPPFASALTVKPDNVDTRDRIAEGFLASLMCCGNNLFHRTKTAFLSGPQVSAGAFSVTPENFERAAVIYAARRIPKTTWLNNCDQWIQPNRKLSRPFIVDCAVWSIFDNNNHTVSIRNVEYKGSVYQVVNHFFPFPISEIRQWNIKNRDIKAALLPAADSFAAKWLLKQKLSAAAEKVFEAARGVYRFYFAHLDKLPVQKFKIESFDAGWRQIRLALQDVSLGDKELAELKQQHDFLREKLLPQLYHCGIIR